MKISELSCKELKKTYKELYSSIVTHECYSVSDYILYNQLEKELLKRGKIIKQTIEIYDN